MSINVLSQPEPEGLSMQLQCPMPQLDFDRITMGHGSGGRLSRQLLDSGVFDLLSNPYLDQQHDGAIFTLEGRTAMTTDSFVVSPIFFPGGDIGDLAINGTVNDLAMCGAVPQFLSLGFILEEGLAMTDFWRVLVSIRNAARQAGVQVVTGDTKVVERGKGDQIFINTTGIGKVLPQARIDARRLAAGDVIVLSGEMGAHGMAILSLRQGLEFETTIQSDTAPLHGLSRKLIETFGDQVKVLRDPTRGGVGTVLNELAETAQVGIRIHETDLPVAEQVSSACELLGLDPLYVANEGLFLTALAPEIAEEALALMRQDPVGLNSAVIGRVVPEHPKKVVLYSGIGGKRVVHSLLGEQLPRIC